MNDKTNECAFVRENESPAQKKKSNAGRKPVPLERKKHKMLSLRVTQKMFLRAHEIKKKTGLPLVGIFEQAIAKLEKELAKGKA